VSFRDPFHPFARPAVTPARREEEAERDRVVAAWQRAGCLAERARIAEIITSPAGRQQPHLARAFAFDTDDSAAAVIAVLGATALANEAGDAKATADLIVLAGKRARGEEPCVTTTAGPKALVTATAAAIIAAGKRARNEA
jgi:hypothetical protein